MEYKRATAATMSQDWTQYKGVPRAAAWATQQVDAGEIPEEGLESTPLHISEAPPIINSLKFVNRMRGRGEMWCDLGQRQFDFGTVSYHEDRLGGAQLRGFDLNSKQTIRKPLLTLDGQTVSARKLRSWGYPVKRYR